MQTAKTTVNIGFTGAINTLSSITVQFRTAFNMELNNKNIELVICFVNRFHRKIINMKSDKLYLYFFPEMNPVLPGYSLLLLSF